MSNQKEKHSIHPRHLMEMMKAARVDASSRPMSVAEFIQQCPEEVRLRPSIKKKK